MTEMNRRNFLFRTVASAAVSALLSCACGMDLPQEPPVSETFTVIHEETTRDRWGLIMIVIRHASGACFVSQARSGLAQVDASVCDYYQKVETTK